MPDRRDAEDSAPSFDLTQPRRIHIVGIGGAGMSGIALMLARLGHHVSGSDLSVSSGLERLRLHGIDARVGHDAANLPNDVDVVTISTAIPPSNVEVRAAEQRGISILRRAEMLELLVRTKRSIAVSGTHGKTTTSSMLALILHEAGWRPSFLIGGQLNEMGGNATLGEGEWLVVEADESDGTFLALDPNVAVVTNVEPDHLDFYGDFPTLRKAFRQFIASARDVRMVCADDPVARELATEVEGAVTYGESAESTYRIDNYEGGRSWSRFSFSQRGKLLGAVEMVVPGKHNARNAAGALGCAMELGISFEDGIRALGRFTGVARRFQFHGQIDGITLVDDYAHLPAEVVAAISTACEGGWDRVVAVFQPHRYTRTAALWREFADAFVGADVVMLTDVYGAGEQPLPGISGRLVLRAVLEAHPTSRVVYIPRRAELLGYLRGFARRGDLVITLGAGDLSSLHEEWLGSATASFPGARPLEERAPR